MGTVIVNNTCDTGITLHWNGINPTPIPGLHVTIDTPTGPLGPLPTVGVIDANPNATYTFTWWETDGLGEGEDFLLGSQTVTTPALLTDCVVIPEDTTTTTTAPPPVPVPPVATLAPPVTIPAIDLGVTACTDNAECTGTTTTVVEIGGGQALPATGGGETLAGIGFGILVAGVLAVWAARRRNEASSS